jgi:hypothetical protein
MKAPHGMGPGMHAVRLLAARTIPATLFIVWPPIEPTEGGANINDPSGTNQYPRGGSAASVRGATVLAPR